MCNAYHCIRFLGWVHLVRSGLLFLACVTVTAQPASEAQIQQLAQEGGRALAQQRYREAEQAYEKLRALSPRIAEVHAQLGLAYFQQGKFAQAVPSFQQALKLKPSLPNLDVMLGMSLSELGKYQEAVPSLQKGFARTTDAILKRSVGLQLQRAYTGMQQDDKAVEIALELSRLYPNDPEVLYHSSRLFANYAYLTTVKLSQVAPTSVWMKQTRGETYESQGYFDLAIKEYREILATDPNRIGLHYRIGRSLLARAGQSSELNAEAAAAFESELQLNPSNANAAYELGEIQRKQGNFEQAQKLFELALQSDPTFEEAQVGLGRVLNTLGQPAQAIEWLKKAIQLNTRDEVAFYQLSQAYKALGNAAEQQKALGEFQRLRAQKAQQQPLNTPAQVTRQELDQKQQ